jgi:hypothetical protein
VLILQTRLLPSGSDFENRKGFAGDQRQRKRGADYLSATFAL